MLDQTIFDFPFKLEKYVNNLLKETSDIELALDTYHKAYNYSKEKNGILHPFTTAYVNKYSRITSDSNILKSIHLKTMHDEINEAILNYKGEENINILK